MRWLALVAILVLSACRLFEPEEVSLPPAFVRVCLSLEPTVSDPGDCKGDGHWQSERAPVRQPEITVPLEGVPVRICHFVAAQTCREAPEGHYGLSSTDREGYAVFTPSRPEGAAPDGNANYNVLLNVESFEYEGCSLAVAPVSEYGDVVQIGLRNRYTDPEFHNAHIAELWMMVESC